jgi:transcriptional regulator with XRE-family HTH domain
MTEWTTIRRRISRLRDDELAAEARACGVPHGTLWNIHKGVTKNPRVETYMKLARRFGKKAA